MKTKWTQLWCGNDRLGKVNIKRGIFQGDSFSPLMFILALAPLSSILNNMKSGYTLSGGIKINHFLYMHDLKLIGKNRREIESLTHTVRVFSGDIGMDFGVEKCATLSIKRERERRRHQALICRRLKPLREPFLKKVKEAPEMRRTPGL